MKKTTKTLLSLLLALVMALQFGIVAPAAFAGPANDLGPAEKEWPVELVVKGPVNDEGVLTVGNEIGLVSNTAGFVDGSLKAKDLVENGLEITPPAGFAVTSFYIAMADGDGNYETALPESTELVEGSEDDDGNKVAKISIPKSFFTKSAFHLSEPVPPESTHAFKLHILLSPATFVPEMESTCKVQGNDAYFLIDGVDNEAYIIGEIPLRDLSETHKTPLIHHEAETQTCLSAVNGEYWECEECGQKFSDANGESMISTIPQLDQLAHKTPLIAHERVDATCAAAGTVAYWECEICGQKFSDANGETPIENPAAIPISDTHKTPLIAHERVDATCAAAGTVAYWECEICGQKFSDANGETPIENPAAIAQLTEHGPLTHHDAVAATPSAPGNIEYWTCPCGKYFRDAEGNNEITQAQTVLEYVSTTYDIIPEGTDTTWKKGSTTGADIEINANFAEVEVSSVKIDETELTSSQYETKQGSVIVTIGPSVLQGLSVGEHSIVVTFSDDKTASSELLIQEADPTTPTALELEIAADGCKKVYDAVDFDLNSLFSHITVKNLPDGYSAEVEIAYEDTTLTSFRDAGSTTVKLSLKSVKNAANENVTDQFTCEDKTGVKLTIEKRKITVQTKDDSKVYDGKAWTSSHMSSNQPIVTYTDPALSSISRDGKTYNHYFTIKYTASPKSMGTYDNTAEVTVREKLKTDPNDTTNYTNVTKNYEITYKFGKIKITDANGNVPNSTSPATGDTSNIWLWVGLMAAAVVLVVVILVFLRKGRKNDGATE